MAGVLPTYIRADGTSAEASPPCQSLLYNSNASPADDDDKDTDSNSHMLTDTDNPNDSTLVVRHSSRGGATKYPYKCGVIDTRTLSTAAYADHVARSALHESQAASAAQLLHEAKERLAQAAAALGRARARVALMAAAAVATDMRGAAGDAAAAAAAAAAARTVTAGNQAAAAIVVCDLAKAMVWRLTFLRYRRHCARSLAQQKHAPPPPPPFLAAERLGGGSDGCAPYSVRIDIH